MINISICFRNNNNHYKALPEKQFQQRNSLLTDLKDGNPHLKTLHHIFIATLICLFVNTTVHDLVKQGRLVLLKREKNIFLSVNNFIYFISNFRTNFGVHLIYLAFNKFPIALLYWITILITTCLSYYLFNGWAKVRLSLSPKCR